jgi:hypothetical protein
MDPHRLAEERSIAYHRVIADRMRKDPAILAAARQRVREWLTPGRTVPPYAQAWDAILARDIEAIAAFLVDRGERARELRQSSPFAGCLSPQERWRLWRETCHQLGDRA